MIYLLSQLLGLIAFIFSVSAYHRNTKEKILNNMICSNILNLFQYFLLNAYTGCVTKIIAIVRDTFIVLKRKNDKLNRMVFLYIFIFLYVIVGYITYTNVISLFPLLAAVLYLIPIWNGNKKTVKITAFTTYFLWLFYNIYVLSIVGVISNSISIVSTGFAIYNDKKKSDVK